MRRLRIVHRTTYHFSGHVSLAAHRLLLRPREGHELHIETSLLETWPSARVHWLRDACDNSVAIAQFDTPSAILDIRSEVIVQHFDEAPLDFVVADYALYYPFFYDSDVAPLLQPFLDLRDANERASLRVWLERFWRPGHCVQTYALLQQLCRGIHESFRYQQREEPGVQSATETLQRGSGSCRDFANLYMEAVRCLGLAARFVSGYLHAPLTMQQFGATHAWVEVYLPGVGWKGFDPTIGEVASSKHIAVAVAHRPEVVSPVTGSYFGALGASLYVGVTVTTP